LVAHVGLKDVVSKVWKRPFCAIEPIRHIQIKLFHKEKVVKKWQRQSIGDLRLRIATTKEIIWRLEQVEEMCPLIKDERALRHHLKSSYLGLLFIQKIKLHE
jgi:hypothetical protein